MDVYTLPNVTSHCILRAIHILGNTLPHPGATVATLYVANLLYLFKGQLLGFIPKLGYQLPYCQEVSVPYKLGCEKQ